MKLFLIRMFLMLVCIYMIWLVYAHFVKDSQGIPDPYQINQIMMRQSYYHTGATLFVVSSGWMDHISRLGGFGTGNGSGTAKAASIGPLIMLRNHVHPMNQARINHELIHYQQCLQSACLLQLWSLIEYLRYRAWGYSTMDAYLLKTTEQEAYLNQHNSHYLTGQNLFDSLKYIPYKVKIEFGTGYEVLNKASL